MASTLSHHHSYINALQHHHHRLFPCYRHRRCYWHTNSLKLNPNLSLRLRAIPESQDPKLSTQADNLDPDLPNLLSYSSSSSSSFSSFFRRLRQAVVIDGLGLEILSIALPAALALAADPITSLVDTAFVGRLGSVELAAVGVSVSVFNLVSKLFNVPLLNVTTSFVAEEQALIEEETIDSSQLDQDADVGGGQHKELLPSVSTSLVLAAGFGFVQAAALFLGSGFLMDILGFPRAYSS